MAIAFQVICLILIIIAALFFIQKNKSGNLKATKGQNALVVFQIILCGWYFSLCLSDFLDIQVSFSLERLVVNILYIISQFLCTRSSASGSFKRLQSMCQTSLVVRWLRLYVPNIGSMSSNPGENLA